MSRAVNEKSISTVSPSSIGYPALLKEIPDFPKNINFLGEINKYENTPKVAIVGTRRPTRYGLEAASDLARELSAAGVIVVSGLAIGIDAAAHVGAIEGGMPTWAVLGSGLQNVQPVINRKLAEKIIKSGGAIISEYDNAHPADKWTFPQRNRIVAGLSIATIVVEAPEHSGALITADLALQYNRDVGAVPGEISSINSRGTNNLIKNGAAIIRNAEDVFELIGVERQIKVLDNADGLENNILRCLNEPQSADELAAVLNRDIQDINRTLTALEIMGMIKNTGGIFIKK